MGKMKELMEDLKNMWSSDDTYPSQAVSTSSSSTAGWSGRFPPDLSQDEKQELASLRTSRHELLKKAKLDAFKKLPRELRQHAINQYMLIDAIKDINDINAPTAGRIAELEARENFYSSTNWPFNAYPPLAKSTLNLGSIALPILNHISVKELMAAHSEACLEEELGG